MTAGAGMEISTPLVLSAWASALANHPDQAFANYICNRLCSGFRIEFKQGSPLRSAHSNMLSARNTLMSSQSTARRSCPFHESSSSTCFFAKNMHAVCVSPVTKLSVIILFCLQSKYRHYQWFTETTCIKYLPGRWYCGCHFLCGKKLKQVIILDYWGEWSR